MGMDMDMVPLPIEVHRWMDGWMDMVALPIVQAPLTQQIQQFSGNQEFEGREFVFVEK